MSIDNSLKNLPTCANGSKPLDEKFERLEANLVDIPRKINLVLKKMEFLNTTVSSPLPTNLMVQTPLESVSPAASLPTTPESPSIKKIILCKVCGVVVPRRKEYHPKICEACQKFFRRNCSRRAQLFCSGGNRSCAVEASSRRCCPRCRFDRCLAVGMQSKLLNTQEKSPLMNGGGNFPNHTNKFKTNNCVANCGDTSSSAGSLNVDTSSPQQTTPPPTHHLPKSDMDASSFRPINESINGYHFQMLQQTKQEPHYAIPTSTNYTNPQAIFAVQKQIAAMEQQRQRQQEILKQQQQQQHQPQMMNPCEMNLLMRNFIAAASSPAQTLLLSPVSKLSGLSSGHIDPPAAAAAFRPFTSLQGHSGNVNTSVDDSYRDEQLAFLMRQQIMVALMNMTANNNVSAGAASPPAAASPSPVETKPTLNFQGGNGFEERMAERLVYNQQHGPLLQPIKAEEPRTWLEEYMSAVMAAVATSSSANTNDSKMSTVTPQDYATLMATMAK